MGKSFGAITKSDIVLLKTESDKGKCSHKKLRAGFKFRLQGQSPITS